VVGGVWLPTDGQADPVNVTQALAKGARMGGATIHENTTVEEIIVENGEVDDLTPPLSSTLSIINRQSRASIYISVAVSHTLIAYKVKGVATADGRIDADVVINCGGMWARDVAAKAGASVPLHACEHFYIVTEALV